MRVFTRKSQARLAPRTSWKRLVISTENGTSYEFVSPPPDEDGTSVFVRAISKGNGKMRKSAWKEMEENKTLRRLFEPLSLSWDTNGISSAVVGYSVEEVTERRGLNILKTR